MSAHPAKRFWKAAEVIPDGGRFALALDGRRVRTPGGLPLAVPSEALAGTIADEWNAVVDKIDPSAMPMTGLANAAIERIAANRQRFIDQLVEYGGSDLLCYRAAEPVELAARQARAWQPWVDWLRTRYGANLIVVEGVMPVAQPADAIDALRRAIAAQDDFALTALFSATTLIASLGLALALVEGAVDVEDAWTAARVDDLYQSERWGSDEEADRRAETIRRELEAAIRFVRLTQG